MSGDRRDGPPEEPEPQLPIAPRGEGLAGEPGFDLVYEWGLQSFPASDPPQAWRR